MSDSIAETPTPPYYAVIFTSIRTPGDNGYAMTADRMMELAAKQDGYLGFESARNEGIGITVSYWRDLESIARWKAVGEHAAAQRTGRAHWYEAYTTRVALVERAYSFHRSDAAPTP
jgi:heme-degrading monooxygenase HmoA